MVFRNLPDEITFTLEGLAIKESELIPYLENYLNTVDPRIANSFYDQEQLLLK